MELDPARGYQTRGNVRFEMADWDKAVSDYTQAIEIDPKNAETFFWRSVAQSRNDEEDSAMADIYRAIDLKPKEAKSYHWRGN
jgi:tetratricopeptide (TPR) repeat protein